MAVYVKIAPYNLSAYLTITGIDAKSPNSLFLLRAIQDVWELNVSRFFKRHEYLYRSQPRLGSKSHKYEDIKTVFFCEMRGNNIVGVIDTSNAPYIHYLIYGAPPSRGAYVPSLGARTDTGMWRGIPTIYWSTWQSFFRKEVYVLIQQFGFDTQRRRRRHRRVRTSDIKKVRAARIAAIRNTIRGMRGGYNGYI